MFCVVVVVSGSGSGSRSLLRNFWWRVLVVLYEEMVFGFFEIGEIRWDFWRRLRGEKVTVVVILAGDGGGGGGGDGGLGWGVKKREMLESDISITKELCGHLLLQPCCFNMVGYVFVDPLGYVHHRAEKTPYVASNEVYCLDRRSSEHKTELVLIHRSLSLRPSLDHSLPKFHGVTKKLDTPIVAANLHIAFVFEDRMTSLSLYSSASLESWWLCEKVQSKVAVKQARLKELLSSQEATSPMAVASTSDNITVTAKNHIVIESSSHVPIISSPSSVGALDPVKSLSSPTKHTLTPPTNTPSHHCRQTSLMPDTSHVTTGTFDTAELGGGGCFVFLFSNGEV
uniref:Uncharacterized protein n=1 Tax=Tanacetum cinerariifolium TaxID=118510 RepID=A0A6L2MTN0_TANCI|nr:hypothetical protein [Tanacetum cinerariifolium]